MKVALLALPNCQIWQVATLQRQLVADGWSMRTLTQGGQPAVTDGGLRLLADGNIYTTSPRDFTLLLVPGGTVTQAHLHDPSLMRFLRQYDLSGGMVGAIGVGTAVIGAAGLIGGLHVVADETCLREFSDPFVHSILEERDVVWDGSVVTARADAHAAFEQGVTQMVKTYVQSRRKTT